MTSCVLQLNSYTTQTSHPSSLYTEQRGWNQGGPPNPPPPSANQTNPSSQSPQRALSQSPAPPPSASPQPQSTSQSQVGYTDKHPFYVFDITINVLGIKVSMNCTNKRAKSVFFCLNVSMKKTCRMHLQLFYKKLYSVE